MNRPLIRSAAFIASVKRLLKKNPEIAEGLRRTLELLSADTYDPLLKTHKLKGKLDGTWACIVKYDVRLVFEFVTWDDEEAILLMALGSHDEVY